MNRNHKTIIRIGLWTLIMTVWFSSCNKEEDGDGGLLSPHKVIALSRSQTCFVRNNNGFAFDLFKKVSESASGKSMILSPISITFALGMVDNGADGVTRQEINKVLGYDEKEIDELNDYCKTMLKESSKTDPSTTIQIANAAVVNSRHSGLKKDYTSVIESYYDALVYNKDFSKEDIRKFINGWCNNKTKGMIPSILNEEVNRDDFAYFLNATYFKGNWAKKFKKQDTKKEKFTMEDGSKVTVDMMRMQETLLGGEVEGLCKVLSMYYGNGAYQITILLPNSGISLQKLRASMGTELWYDIKEKCITGVEADVKLPSFECEYTTDLKGILEDMWMITAFKVGDYSNMTDQKVTIDKVLHRAKLKLNEQGTEAAAVTSVNMIGLTGFVVHTYPSMTFHADHPFVYAISETSTGAIFFIGQYTGK